MSGGTSASTVASAFSTAANSGVGAWLSLGLQAVGTLASTYSAAQQSAAQKKALDYSAKVAENNARLAEQQAHDAVLRGQTEAARLQLKSRQLKGTQKAELAARGIDLGEGSALNILTDTDFMGKIDSNTAIDNAAKEAWGYENQAGDYRANAEAYRTRAKAESPGMVGFSTLLTGAGGVAKSWYDFKEKGAFG